MDENKKNRNAGRDEHDDGFWDDILSLLPRRGQAKHPPRKPRSTFTIDITIDPPDADTAPSVVSKVFDTPMFRITVNKTEKNSPPQPGDSEVLIKRFIPPHTAEEFANSPKPDDEYVPEHILIRKVKIFNWKTSYNYYEQFLAHARKIRYVKGHECRPTPFFSYVPQYSQLSRAQLDWYLWWRERAASGEYLKTDYSYILLFIYEIINTGGHDNPAWGQKQLLGLWSAYRDEFPRFDKMLGEWICDFSLIHHLPPPAAIPGKLPPEAVQSCTLKEFYIAAGGGSAEAYCNMLLIYCTNYNYRSSKFAKGDVLKLYDKHIPGALTRVIDRFSDAGGLLSGLELENSRMIRDAFAGALCSYRIKKRIEVEYCSFSRSHELRFLVTDIIKYSENKLRAHLGIKSRLSIYALPVPIRECIDEYFAELLPKKRKAPEQPSNEYDKLYDVPPAPISPERAAEIERSSWETTERLIEAFGDTEPETDYLPGKLNTAVDELLGRLDADTDIVKDTEDPEKTGSPADITPGTAKVSENTAGATKTTLAMALGELFEFVRLADRRDYAGQRRFAAERGMLPDLVADKINEIAAGVIGDIILAGDDAGYSLIAEYRKEIFDD
ncbi:MAG: hypothetical protein GX057_00295 [Clostridiales bacterium]|nr:hypothetical protein [Clostridiales bacterium]HOA84794.1 TerB N-terminal domain-containing protein [Bacillota bacterium]